MKSRARKFLFISLLSIGAVMGVGWFTVPVWAPALLGQLLPAGWSLSNLNVQRPALGQLQINQASIRSSDSALPLMVELHDAHLTYRNRSLVINDLEITWQGSADVEGGWPNALENLSIPALILPDLSSELTIRNLRLKGLSPLPIEATQVQITPGVEQSLELSTHVDALPWLAVPAQISIKVGRLPPDGHGELQQDGPMDTVLNVQVTNASQGLTAYLQQERIAEGLRTTIAAQLDLDDFDLQLLDPSLTAPLLMLLGMADTAQTPAAQSAGKMSGSSPIKAIRQNGQIEVTASLRGVDVQTLQALELSVHELDLTNASSGLKAEGTLRLDRNDDHWLMSAAPQWQASYTTPVEHWKSLVGQSQLANALPAGIELAISPGSLAQASLSWPAETVVHWHISQPPLQLGLQGGPLIAQWQIDATNFNVALKPGSQWQGPGQAGGPTVIAKVQWQLNDLPPLSITQSELLMDFADLNAAGSGTFQLQAGQLQPFKIEDLQTSLARAKILLAPSGESLIASGVEAGGTLTFAEDGWHFDGPVTGQTLDIHQGADTIASMLSWEMQASLDSDEKGLLTNGTARLWDLSLPTTQLTAQQANVEWTSLDLDTVSGQVDFRANSLELAAQEQALYLPAFSAETQIDQADRVTGQGLLELTPLVQLPFQFEGQLKAPTLVATLPASEVPAAELGGIASAIGFAWPQGVSLSDGMVLINGQVNALPQPAITFEANSDGINGQIAASAFEALRFSVTGDYKDALSARGTAQAPRFDLAAGLVMSDLNVNYRWQETLLLDQLSAQLLDGQLLMHDVRLEIPFTEPAVLLWQGVDLRRLLQFADIQGLDGNGMLNAMLPLMLSDDGLSITNGQLSASEPGLIRYNSGVPASNIGLQALENFRYDEMTGTLDYNPIGPYQLGLNLLGQNPDLYGGHPIRFRLNINGELPALFKSLFLTGSFEDALLNSIQSGDNAPWP